MPLTPEEVQAKKFTVTRFRPGYDEDEVDAFLDEVEAELRRLLGENSDLRTRGAVPAAAAAVAPTPAAPARPEEGQEAALRTLLLAQRTADEAVAQAKAEAEQIVRSAQERAATMEREAQQQHAGRLAQLDRDRKTLEAQVEELRRFETDYRTRLKAYLEGQLRELETKAGVAPPRSAPTGAPPPPAGGSVGAPGAPAAPPRVAPPGSPAPSHGASAPGGPGPAPFAPGTPFSGQQQPDHPPREPGGPDGEPHDDGGVS